MLTTSEVRAHLARITYKPGWTFTVYDGRFEGQHVVIRAAVPHAHDPNEMIQLDIHSALPPCATVSHLEDWLMWRLARIEIHEMREFFQVDGRCPAGPHVPFADRDY